MKFILGIIEKHKSIPLYDLDSFKKWLNFIRFIPQEQFVFEEDQNDRQHIDNQQIIDEHIRKIIQFSNFKKSILSECIKAFVEDRVTSKSSQCSSENAGISFSRQDQIDQKTKYFGMIYEQLLGFNQSSSHKDIDAFYSVLNVLFKSNPLETNLSANLHPQLLNAFQEEL